MSKGKVAYEGYFEKCGGKSLISGAPLPAWDDQADAIKEAWEAAATAVMENSETDPPGPDDPDDGGHGH